MRKSSVRDFIKKLDEKMELLNMKEEMAERYLNEGSQVVRKKNGMRILQLLMLEPTFALWTKLTLVWISMLLRSYQRVMRYGVKVLEL